MQNEPNYNTTIKLKDHPATPDSTNIVDPPQEESMERRTQFKQIRNENPLESCVLAPVSFAIIYPHKAAFPKNSTKKHALLHSFTARTRALFIKELHNLHRNPRFLSLSINDTLNSLYNKDLHKYFSPA